MKRIQYDSNGLKLKAINVFWKEHSFGCEKCRQVNLNKSATFSLSCAEGGPLLMEELKKRVLPEIKARQEKELEFAIRAGVFHIPKGTKMPRSKDD